MIKYIDCIWNLIRFDSILGHYYKFWWPQNKISIVAVSVFQNYQISQSVLRSYKLIEPPEERGIFNVC